MAIDPIESRGDATQDGGITPEELATPGLPVLAWIKHENVQPGDSLGSFFQTEEDDHLAPYRPQPRVPVEVTGEGDTSKVEAGVTEAPAPQSLLWTEWGWEEAEPTSIVGAKDDSANEDSSEGDDSFADVAEAVEELVPATDEAEVLKPEVAEIQEPAPSLSDTTFYNSMVATSGLKRVLPRIRTSKEPVPSFTAENTELHKNRPWALLAAGSVAVTLAFSKARNFKGFRKEPVTEDYSTTKKTETLKALSRTVLAEAAIGGLVLASEVSNFAESIGKKVSQERRRQILKVGGIATLAAGTGLLAYFAQRGLHSPSAPHEAIKPSSTPNVDLLHDFKLPIHAQAVVAQAGHHAHKAHQFVRQFTVQPGDGYTQILAKYYKGKSPAELYHGYKEGIKHFGPNFIRGVRHYHMANGDFGLFQGKAHLSAKAAKFFARLGWRS